MGSESTAGAMNVPTLPPLTQAAGLAAAEPGMTLTVLIWLSGAAPDLGY